MFEGASSGIFYFSLVANTSAKGNFVANVLSLESHTLCLFVNAVLPVITELLIGGIVIPTRGAGFVRQTLPNQSFRDAATYKWISATAKLGQRNGKIVETCVKLYVQFYCRMDMYIITAFPNESYCV